MNRTLNAILLSAGLCMLTNLSVAQTIVYDNTATPATGNPQYFPTPPTLEFGDQITLSGTDRTISQFSFYRNLSGSTAASVILRFYANSGANPPTTAFYTSDPIQLSIAGSGTETVTFPLDSNAVTLPDTFTWTVQFSGLAAGQTGGLLLYGPPSPGSSFNDFWQKDGAGVWSLNQVNNGAIPGNFGAQVTAVPEPGVLVLGGLGVLLLGGLRRCHKAPR